jgi:hypothetical protein
MATNGYGAMAASPNGLVSWLRLGLCGRLILRTEIGIGKLAFRWTNVNSFRQVVWRIPSPPTASIHLLTFGWLSPALRQRLTLAPRDSTDIS